MSHECNSIETSYPHNQQFRLNKINEMKDYFIAEIKERKLMGKRLIYQNFVVSRFLRLQTTYIPIINPR